MRCVVLPFAIVIAAALPSMAAAELYAAIAFSPSTGISGTSWNFDTQNLAETEAYAQCGQEDCDTVTVFTQCGAIAVGDGYGYGFGSDLSLANATDTALANCDGFTTSCEVTAAFCNEGY